MRLCLAKSALLCLLSAPLPARADDKVCASCHAAIYKSYLSTPMAQTSGDVAADNAPVGENDAFTAGDIAYQVTRKGDGIWVRETEAGLGAEQQLRYFLGAGLVGRSFGYGTQGWEIGDQERNAYNLSAERSISAHDVPQYFTTSLIWDLPVGRGKRFGGNMNKVVDGIIGNWQVSTIISFA
ncbi:MAG TPA: hypothetical protein VGL97_20930, partial [Bryobacteraceae bacterium]